MKHQAKPPVYHGTVSILSIIFYAFCAIDYLVVKLMPGLIDSMVGPELMVYVGGLPNWLNIVWAVAVWSGLLGAWLLFRLNRLSVLILFAAFACLAFLTAWITFLHIPTLIASFGLTGILVMGGATGASFLIYAYARKARSAHWI